jgi:transcriptional regulator with XRE-family HTH domain
MRPKVQLDPELLKRYRTAAGLTQDELAQASIELDDNTHKITRSHYQKIERSGKTSPKSAKLIAKALGVSISELQQPNFDNRKIRLQELIKSAVKRAGEENSELSLNCMAETLDFYKEILKDGQELKTADDGKYGQLVDKISHQIEWLYLSGRSDELESLAKIFGLTTKEIRPAALRSYWLFSSSNLRRFSLGTLVSGHQGVLEELEQNWNTIRAREQSYDITIAMMQKGKMYSLNFELPRGFSFSCEFYACNATRENGIQSLDPSPWEHEKLMASLKKFLFERSNYVEIDGKQFPPKNLPISLCHYKVEFFSVNDRGENQKDGERNFGLLEIIVPLHIWLKEHGENNLRFLPPRFLESSLDGLDISLMKDGREIAFCEITKYWKDDEGNFQKIHWTNDAHKNFFHNVWSNDLEPLCIDKFKPFAPELQSHAWKGVAK